jgi:hypothetical protein
MTEPYVGTPNDWTAHCSGEQVRSLAVIEHRGAIHANRRIFTPATTVAYSDDGIHIVQFWNACPQRPSMRGDAADSAGAPGRGPRLRSASASGRPARARAALSPATV